MTSEPLRKEEQTRGMTVSITLAAARGPPAAQKSRILPLFRGEK